MTTDEQARKGEGLKSDVSPNGSKDDHIVMRRMPVFFGPAPGPRQRPELGRWSVHDTPTADVVWATFDADTARLSTMLPPGFTVADDATLTYEFTYFTRIEWLAGRGYNTAGVRIPATFRGEVDEVEGDLLLVLWENLADPIITGREELGFAKLYAEIPELRETESEVVATASWQGFRFLGLALEGLDVDEDAAPAARDRLHYKYIPRTGDWGVADAEYAVRTFAQSSKRVLQRWKGAASLTVNAGSFGDLPTLHYITTILKEVTGNDLVGAGRVRTVGGKDFRDQQILR